MNKEFEVHKLNKKGLNNAEYIAECFNYLLNQLLLILPESRELSIMRTKLEEACFFAKKAMAVDPVNWQL